MTYDINHPFQFKSNLGQELRDYTVITLGLVLYSIGLTFFILPYEITTGGMTGVASLVFYASGFPVQYTYFAINITLLCAAVKILGWRFCIKTIFAVCTLTFLIGFTQSLALDWAVSHPEWFHAMTNPHSGLPMVVRQDPLLSCIIGAALEGVGIGMVLLSGGSSGGTDIIASIVNKYRDVTLGQMMMLLDLFIISSSMLLPGHDINKLFYGYTNLIICNLMLDYVINSSRQSVQFLIFSRRYDEIASAINLLHRGVTVLHGTGWYTKTDRNVLVVLAKKSESGIIFRIIQSIDPSAFVSQCKVAGVFGEGFDRIKVKAKQLDKKAMAIPKTAHAARE